MFKSTKLTVIKYSQNNTNMIWKQYLTWQKTTKYNQYQWTELNTFFKNKRKDANKWKAW